MNIKKEDISKLKFNDRIDARLRFNCIMLDSISEKIQNLHMCILLLFLICISTISWVTSYDKISSIILGIPAVILFGIFIFKGITKHSDKHINKLEGMLSEYFEEVTIKKK